MSALAQTDTIPRSIGRFAGDRPGPKMVIVALMHGNEPAGAEAARRVLSRLESGTISFRGELVALVGNTRAAAAHMRYVDKDLNRAWTPERIEQLRRSTPDERTDAEDDELYELLQALDGELGSVQGEAYFLDLHTTSAEGVPFVLFGDTLRNRAFARKLPLTHILGLEEQLDGTALEYMNSLGLVTLGCEGGQHRTIEAVENLEAVLWLSLAAAGMIDSGAADLQVHRQRLVRARGSKPAVIEVRYRHAIQGPDRFHMRPGFTNLDAVEAGTLLARDSKGEIRATWDGWLLMPLYQGQGNDGFFLAAEVRDIWLEISAWLRKARLSPLLRLLPGVRSHPERADSLVVDTRVARWFPLQVFHLFGFRKLRWQGPILVVSRRAYDLRPPGKERG